MKAYVLVNGRTGEIKDVVKQFKKIEQVKEAPMTFGPYDAVACLRLRMLIILARCLRRSFSRFRGSKRLSPASPWMTDPQRFPFKRRSDQTPPALAARVDELRVGLNGVPPTALADKVGASYTELGPGRGELRLSLFDSPLVFSVFESNMCEIALSEIIDSIPLISASAQATAKVLAAARRLIARGFCYEIFSDLEKAIREERAQT